MEQVATKIFQFMNAWEQELNWQSDQPGDKWKTKDEHNVAQYIFYDIDIGYLED